MRNVDSKNQIWFMQENRVTKIGFTRDFLNSLDECWQILPANLRQFKEKAPMLTVETNDGLMSILSPVTGPMIEFNDAARDFPDSLTDETVILTIGEGTAARRAQAAPNLDDDAHINLQGAGVGRWDAAHALNIGEFHARIAQQAADAAIVPAQLRPAAPRRNGGF